MYLYSLRSWIIINSELKCFPGAKIKMMQHNKIFKIMNYLFMWYYKMWVKYTITDKVYLLYSSLLTVAVNLLIRQRVAVAANTKLYRSTIRKLPSHSMRPKSPRRSKFVMPESGKDNILWYVLHRNLKNHINNIK